MTENSDTRQYKLIFSIFDGIYLKLQEELCLNMMMLHGIMAVISGRTSSETRSNPYGNVPELVH
jgi:hypothetical protein